MVDEKSMAAIGKKEANVAFDTMNGLEDEETNWKDRWPLWESWQKLKPLTDDCYEGCGRPPSPPGVPADFTCSTLKNDCLGHWHQRSECRVWSDRAVQERSDELERSATTAGVLAGIEDCGGHTKAAPPKQRSVVRAVGGSDEI